MRGIILWSLATATTLLQTIQAIELVKRETPAVVGFQFERRKIANPVEHDRRRRKRQNQPKVVDKVLDNEQTLYFCNLTLGTPPQSLRMHIDTGSSDLWVNTPTSSFCQDVRRPCQGGGTYDPTRSSTYKLVNNDFNITYADGSTAAGDYVTDSLGLSGLNVTDFQFAIGLQSTSREGVLGIGFVENEASVVRSGDQPYPNLPQALKDKGFINANAYSIWLNDLSASKGEILFGGVNTAKYKGSLRSLPVVLQRRGHADLSIALTGLSVTSGSSTQNFPSDNFPFSVVLDTGSSLTYLPNVIVAAIFDALSAVWDSRFGAAYVPCNLANSDIKFTFTFSGPNIVVPMDELVINPGPNSDGQTLTFRDGTPACIFGIAPAQSSVAILGDTFLRSAYVVYDLGNREISLAQTNFNSTDNQILEIKSGKSGVPDATGVPSAVSRAGNNPTATVQTSLTPIATNRGGVRPTRNPKSAAPTMKPEQFRAALAALLCAALVFIAK